jgi:hypothetical protein
MRYVFAVYLPAKNQHDDIELGQIRAIVEEQAETTEAIVTLLKTEGLSVPEKTDKETDDKPADNGEDEGREDEGREDESREDESREDESREDESREDESGEGPSDSKSKEKWKDLGKGKFKKIGRALRK